MKIWIQQFNIQIKDSINKSKLFNGTKNKVKPMIINRISHFNVKSNNSNQSQDEILVNFFRIFNWKTSNLILFWIKESFSLIDSMKMAQLKDENEQVEHIVLQLQCQTETIGKMRKDFPWKRFLIQKFPFFFFFSTKGDFIDVYQQQGEKLEKRKKEKDEIIERLNDERIYLKVFQMNLIKNWKSSFFVFLESDLRTKNFHRWNLKFFNSKSKTKVER